MPKRVLYVEDVYKTMVRFQFGAKRTTFRGVVAF
jgi:hypothetical protein